jgi:hypothetical protein
MIGPDQSNDRTQTVASSANCLPRSASCRDNCWQQHQQQQQQQQVMLLLLLSADSDEDGRNAVVAMQR